MTAALAAGCGSGSAGFDDSPESEAEALLVAMRSGSCVSFDERPYCGSGASTTIDDAAVASMDIQDPSEALACVEVPDQPQCTATLAFSATGFPDGTVFLAVSGDHLAGPWTLASTETVAGDDHTDGQVDVTLADAGSMAAASKLIVVVLAYLGGTPADLPEQAPLVGDFAPDIVYVSNLLEVQPSP
ncbi:MAG: hypothetical protein HY899_10920 [Deltaproteobacteria bacterium]|nr:hypothetical protein [Deltaproteobacteria bacterium]